MDNDKILKRSGSMQVPSTCGESLLGKSPVIPMSSSVVDAPRKDECLPMMEQLGGGGKRGGKERRGEGKEGSWRAQPRRGVLLAELTAKIKDLPLSKESRSREATPGVREDEQGTAVRHQKTTRRHS